MIPPVVTGSPVLGPALIVGQAPGPREGALGRPFAWTAGRTLFGWFGRIGADEATVRARVAFTAVCRCFPGKASTGGGDRVPDTDEIAACRPWLEGQIALVDPALVIAVGKLAIGRWLPDGPLAEVVGPLHRATIAGAPRDLVALPHPSGASTWFRRPPGDALLTEALRTISAHPAWGAVTDQNSLYT
jgi:uracil-DNA glycosylase